MEADEKMAKLEKLTLLRLAATDMIKALMKSHGMGDVTIVVGLGTPDAGCAWCLGNEVIAADVCNLLSGELEGPLDPDEPAAQFAPVYKPVPGLDDGERAIQW